MVLTGTFWRARAVVTAATSATPKSKAPPASFVTVSPEP